MITDLNLVNLVGRLTREPELRYTTNGHALAEFSVATTEKYVKDGEAKESTTFVDCKAWQGMAEKVATLKKGGSVVVIGKLKTDSWEDKQTQQKRYKTYVLAEVVTSPFGGPKKKEEPPKREPPKVEEDDVPF